MRTGTAQGKCIIVTILRIKHNLLGDDLALHGIGEETEAQKREGTWPWSPCQDWGQRAPGLHSSGPMERSEWYRPCAGLGSGMGAHPNVKSQYQAT